MINHIVLFKVKVFDKEQDKRDVMNEMKKQIENLKNEIPEVQYLEVGLHHNINSPSYDVSLISHFNSVDDLEVYRTHPAHIKVVAYINTVTDSRAAVDYEF